MSISAPFIRRPIGTALLALGLILAGITAYFDLPVAPLPRVDFPTIVVSASQPGASPEVMASSVAAPLERHLGEIQGVSEMTSTSSLGSTSVVVQFELSRDIASAARDVQAAINAAGTDLPAGLPSPPTFRRANPADAPILLLALTSDTLPTSTLYDVADSIVGPRIAQVNGTAQVVISGADQPAVRVQVDPSAATAADVSLENIRQAISNANVTQPVGLIDGQHQAFSISVNDHLDSAAQFANIVVKTTNGAMVRLDSVANVSQGVRDRRQTGGFNGRPAVLLIIFKQPDANVIQVVDHIKELIPTLQKWLPAGVKFNTIRDSSISIRASVDEVQFTLAISVVLVIMVVAAFLRRGAAVLAAGIAVPLSLLGTLGVMWLADYSLDNLSLMALTISVGFVVDDAIVVIENMARLQERGMRPMQAALEGAKQIGFTIVSITVSLIAVFIPLLFMGGIVGRLFREFSVTLAIAVAISGLISLTVTPMVACYLGRETEPKPGRFGRAFEACMSWCTDFYMRTLSGLLRFEWSMLAFCVALVGLTVFLYVKVPKGFFPEQDTGLLMGMTQAAPDTSFQRMAKLQQEVVRIIMADPAVAYIGTQVGGGNGNSSVTRGRMFISLKPLSERHVSADEVINRLRPKLMALPGINAFMFAAQDIRVGGRVGGASYQYVLLTPDLDELRKWANLLLEKLRTIPQITDVNSDQDQASLVTQLVIDRDAATRLGVNITTLDAALNDAFSQRQVSVIYRTRNQYRVVQEVSPNLTEDPTNIARIYVPGSGGQIPLSTFTKVERVPGPLTINHQGQFPAATLSFNLAPGVSLGQATQLINRAVLEIGMPADVRTEFAGNAKVFQSFLSNEPILIAAALVTIYIVLGILYESAIHPLTILSTLPTAGIGALLALMVTGLPFTVIALIGVILLMGIVKKNAIMLVDFALEHEREEGLGSRAAILAACRERFRPILMTTLAAMLGAVPLAIVTGEGAELRQPLGVTIIGGLIFSQMLTLYTTPVIYLFFDKFARHRRRTEEQGAPAT